MLEQRDDDFYDVDQILDRHDEDGSVQYRATCKPPFDAQDTGCSDLANTAGKIEFELGRPSNEHTSNPSGQNTQWKPTQEALNQATQCPKCHKSIGDVGSLNRHISHCRGGKQNQEETTAMTSVATVAVTSTTTARKSGRNKKKNGK